MEELIQEKNEIIRQLLDTYVFSLDENGDSTKSMSGIIDLLNRATESIKN